MRPLYMLYLCGLSVFDENENPGGKRAYIRILIFMGTLSLLFLSAVWFNGFLFERTRYGYIPQLRFLVQFYGMFFFCQFIFFMTMLFQRQIVGYYNEVLKCCKDMDKMEIKYDLNTSELYILFTVLLTSATCIFVCDILEYRSNYSIFCFVSIYTCGIISSIYILVYVYIMKCSGSVFKAVNDFVLSMAQNDATILEKIRISKENILPERLSAVLEGEKHTVFIKILIIHDQACDSLNNINFLIGYDLLLYCMNTVLCLLSEAFDTSMNLVLKGTKYPPTEQRSFAASYWSIVYLVIWIYMMNSCNNVNKFGNATKIYLHKLRNIYPMLKDEIEMFSLQFIHQSIDITAAKYYTLNRSILYKVAVAFVTYIIVFVQLELKKLNRAAKS